MKKQTAKRGGNPAAADYCRVEDFIDCFLEPITRDQLLRLSKESRFPRFMRPSGPKSTPLFLKSEIEHFFEEKYWLMSPGTVFDVRRALGLKVKK